MLTGSSNTTSALSFIVSDNENYIGLRGGQRFPPVWRDRRRSASRRRRQASRNFASRNRRAPSLGPKRGSAGADLFAEMGPWTRRAPHQAYQPIRKISIVKDGAAVLTYSSSSIAAGCTANRSVTLDLASERGPGQNPIVRTGEIVFIQERIGGAAATRRKDTQQPGEYGGAHQFFRPYCRIEVVGGFGASPAPPDLITSLSD